MRLRFQISIFTLLRTIFNTVHRMAYPFLGVFARGLGVDVTTISLAITSRSVIGMFIPFISSISDHRGRKFGMLVGAATFTAAVSLVAIYPSAWTLGIALILALLGKFLFDPAMQAYIGDRIPYQRRGLALSVTEFGWSLAFIGGIPLVGLLISRFGWSAPFPVFALLGVGMIITILLMIPNDHPETVVNNNFANFKLVLTSIPTLAGIFIGMFASAGNELVNLIFGVWLEDTFALKISALAIASAIIGISELSGEGLVAVFTDRLGKKRALTVGLLACGLSSILLPLISGTETGALVGLSFFYITFEFVMVSHVPLMTEQLPAARATVMSFNLTGHSLGRVMGALLATFIYQSFGFTIVTILSAVFYGLALLALQKVE
jgi:predicted MFS family arabinose efflux permease